MTEHSDEAKVRAAWEYVALVQARGSYSVLYGGMSGIRGFNTACTVEATAWEMAAAYTDEHAQKIAEVDEEIDLITHDAAESDERGWSKELQTYKRILAARQAARAELMRGWRGGM